MILTADFAYDETKRTARGGVVAFAEWASTVAAWIDTVEIETIEPYVPGAFYKRELPCWLRALESARQAGLQPHVLVVDGYATFGAGREALGVHLHRESGLPVVGVAKTAFHGVAHVEVRRGTSSNPLFVTAVGMSTDDAAIGVKAMAGPHRIPSMLKLADSLARGSTRS